MDDTPVRVLAPSKRIDGIGKGVKEGRIWTYLGDDRPWAGTAPPGVACHVSPDRKCEHPRRRLTRLDGILQADAYSGFKALYEPDDAGKERIREAACWAHPRRDLHDVRAGTKTDIAREALGRIGKLCDIDREITGRPREERLAVPTLGNPGHRHLAFVINGPPEAMHLAVDLHEYLVQVPSLIRVGPQFLDAFSANLGSKHRAEPVPPKTDGLIARLDAALVQEIPDIPQQLRKSDARYHRSADDLR